MLSKRGREEGSQSIEPGNREKGESVLSLCHHWRDPWGPSGVRVCDPCTTLIVFKWEKCTKRLGGREE